MLIPSHVQSPGVRAQRHQHCSACSLNTRVLAKVCALLRLPLKSQLVPATRSNAVSQPDNQLAPIFILHFSISATLAIDTHVIDI